MNSCRAILIAGPTASGKSALALQLAQERGGVVVNADSMQVYRDLRILTARPADGDLRTCEHALYGHIDGAEPYSVARWLTDAAETMARCWRSGRLPIVVGGTGLYFKARLEGLSPVPPVPDEIRTHWRGKAERLGSGELHALLAARDMHTAARLQPNDRQRLTRALEVLDATGRGLSDWQREKGVPVVEASQVERLLVVPDRNVIYHRADARLDRMIGSGAVDEVRALTARGITREAPVMRALGVGRLRDAIEGRTTLPNAVAHTKLDTRHYIKRQLTWIKRHMIAWKLV